MEKYIDTGDGKIYYWMTKGDLEKPTLILLHGLSSNHTTWDPMVEYFSQKGYPTLALDLRGHGLSDKTRRRSLYTVQQMRSDLERIIESEQIDHYIIVGYSYGAYIGLDYAVAHPDGARALILMSGNHVSPFSYSSFPFVTPIAHVAINLLGWLLIGQSRSRYYYFNPKEAQGYWKSTFSGHATMPLSINFWMLSEVFALDYRGRLGNIQSPTLILRGTTDAFVTEKEASDMARAIPRAETRSIGLGHYIATHYLELCAAEIEKFI